MTLDHLSINKQEVLKAESINEESPKNDHEEDKGDQVVEDPKKKMPLPAEAKIIERDANIIEKECNNIDKQAEFIHNIVHEKEQEMFEKTKPKEEEIKPDPLPVQDIPALEDMTPEVGDQPKDEEEGDSTQSDKSPQEATYTKMKTVEYEEQDNKVKEHPDPVFGAPS